ELSVKFTKSGFTPMIGLALKAAATSEAPVPVTVLVLLPPLLVKTTTLLTKPALAGAKYICTVAEPKPGTLKGTPWRTPKGELNWAVPLVMEAPPRLVTTKLA